ncbi:MAG: methionine--tRNA ligase, partial [Gammaproteobacteria bacterium]
MTAPNRLIVTHALPYANGPIHLGHLLESIQTDIWVRFQRLKGREVAFICADDAHGTAIMLKAEQMGIDPETLISQIQPQHYRDLTAFGVSFDHYGTTHDPTNEKLCGSLYQALKGSELLGETSSTQLYDESRQMFLADRMVKGQCPICSTEDQYGDVCEKCGSTYDAVQLINPVSNLTQTRPSVREASNLCFNLHLMQPELTSWLKQADIQPAVQSKLNEWLDQDLKPWTISRPAPYFGFRVPESPDRYFYVWVDAPLGYISSLDNWLKKNEQKEQSWQDWWHEDTEVCHFIGKDIIYFHTLFWPAMLMALKLKLPDRVHVHGFLTVNGSKMSKSRGTLVEARKYLDLLPPDALRYYLAARLG